MADALFGSGECHAGHAADPRWIPAAYPCSLRTGDIFPKTKEIYYN